MAQIHDLAIREETTRAAGHSAGCAEKSPHRRERRSGPLCFAVRASRPASAAPSCVSDSLGPLEHERCRHAKIGRTVAPETRIV